MEAFRARQAVAVILMTLAAGLAACSRKPTKAEQIAALDGAYQSGVLTKDEYDVKKAALVGTPPVAPAPVPVAPPEPVPVAPAPAAIPPEPAAPAPARAAPTPRPAPVAEPEPTPAPSAGCEDVSGKDKGTQERIFAQSVAVVKKAAVAALKTLDFNIHSDENNAIEASKKRHIGVIVGAGGERVVLRFKAVPQGTRVTAETKKSFVGRMAQKSWSSAVLAQTACNLKTAR